MKFMHRPQNVDEAMRLAEGMTLRQYAAIKLRVPNSGTDWLDEMIRAAIKDELSAKAMQALLTHYGDRSYIADDGGRTSLHLAAYDHAESILAARGNSK